MPIKEERLHRNAQQRRSSGIHLRRKVLTELTEQQTVEQQAVELKTFRPLASLGKRNERYYEKAQELMKKNGETEV